MKFIITVDTEADNQWRKPEQVTLQNIKCLPRFQQLCEKYGFPVTYLVSYEVAQDSESAALLKSFQDKGTAEIGAHLHPWMNPPLTVEEQTLPLIQRLPCELPDKLLQDNLVSLTQLIQKQFGKAPTSYRAGRWGMDARSIQYLEELGYLVDCSVTPKLFWRNVHKTQPPIDGPDFRKASVHPYRLSQSQILEVPMSILFTASWVKEGSWLAKAFLAFPEGLLKRFFAKLVFRPKWLRIFNTTTSQDFVLIYQKALKENLPVLEFMIHSSELMVEGSPYSKTQEAMDHIYVMLEAMLVYFQSVGLQGMTLTEYAKHY